MAKALPRSDASFPRLLAALAGAWLAAACGGAAERPQNQICAANTKACGNGCIPESGVCCDVDGTTSSYCTNAAGGGCLPNTGHRCSAAFPAEIQAAYCCDANGDFGSNDCPAGEHHCGLLCQPLARPCATAGVDGGSDGGSETCALSGRRCEVGASCCNGLTTVRDATSGLCSCYYVDGQACWAGGNVSPYRSQECCNPPGGGVAGIGIVRSACAATASGTCSQDSDCYVGTGCTTWGGEQVCQGLCAGGGWTPTAEVPCCAGFVISSTGVTSGMCALASGQLCNFDLECASDSCVPGATTSTCR